MKFSNKIVALVLGLNIVFAVAVLLAFWHTGAEPAALVAAWFAFTTGELWMLASIKKTKVKNGKGDKEAEVEADD